jgi:transposase
MPDTPKFRWSSGWTPTQVAEVLLISEGSVRTYFKDFKQYGKEELIRRDYAGRESFLSEEQEQFFAL